MKSLLLPIMFFSLLGCSSYEIQRDPIFEETKIRNSRPRLKQEVFDVKESEHKYENAFVDADLISERKVGNVKRDKNFIFEFWRHKKKVLSDKYGIDWESPAELNPAICYESYGQPCISKLEKLAIFEVVGKSRVSAKEDIIGARRDFRGFVYVGTHEADRDTSRQYRLIGHEKEWELLDVFIIEE